MHGADFQDSLCECFSPDMLPTEYGGEGPGIEEACQLWTNQLLQSENLLRQLSEHLTGDVTVTTDD